MQVIPWIIVGCWRVFIGYWVVSSFGVKRDATRASWMGFWWLRMVLVFVIVGWLWGASSFGRATSHLWISNASVVGPLAAVGAVLCVLGIGIAVWARVYLGRNWSPAPALKHGHELVTSGPYTLVRHPIYTGVILAVLGSTLASPQWLIIFFLITGMFIWRVHVEEALMLKQFPNQYPEYKKRTWALIPYIW